MKNPVATGLNCYSFFLTTMLPQKPDNSPNGEKSCGKPQSGDIEPVTSSPELPFEPFLSSPVQCSPLGLSQSRKERDIVAELLADKRSEGTRLAYIKDLRDFFRTVAGSDPSPNIVAAFLALDRYTAFSLVIKYKGHLIAKGLSESTINRRLAAIKGLVSFSRKLGHCDYTLEDVKGEKVKAYRDTRGIDIKTFKRVLELCDRSTLKGKRDYAILHLLWSSALRRSEICRTDIKDLDPEAESLCIFGKGRGTQKEIITLGHGTVAAILDWLKERRCRDKNAPLFCSVSRYQPGHRLSGEGLRKLIDGYCKKAGISRKMSPHRIRHSSITHALDTTGDVRKVQRLSRHVSLETLIIYDDNRQNMQGELSELLSGELD